MNIDFIIDKIKSHGAEIAVVSDGKEYTFFQILGFTFFTLLSCFFVLFMLAFRKQDV